MKKFSEFICKNRVLVLIVSFALLILSFIGMKLTKINYDILVYLPDDIETIKGQNILTDEFNMGAYAMVITDNLKADEILKVEEEMRKVDGVNKVVSLYDALGTDFPIEVLPNDIRSHLNKDNSNLLLVTFEESTSSEKTIDAVRELRTLSDNYKIGGMSSMVLDTMDLSNSEIAIYIVIAVVLCLVVLAFSLDSYLVPVLLLLNIGMAIMYNMGTNIFLGEISYITKALVAVLQLGVTTDFSIFLYHSYENKKNKMSKEKAMEEAISETFTSVTGSSLTTIAGFLVLCLMNLTLGKDLGIVMAKGVLLGLVSVLTVFPALLLTFDKYISKTSHKVVIKPFNKVNDFIVKHYIAIFIIFLLLLFPMYKANSKVEVYYKIDETLPKTLESISSNEEIKEKFNIVSPEIILIDKNIKSDKLSELTNKLDSLDGVNLVFSKSKITDLGLMEDMIPEEINSILNNDKYTVIFVNSLYEVASDELNDQITEINKVVKSYDKDAIVAGEGALMKDLITISDEDFNNVNTWSVICILFILIIILRRVALPILLVMTIEFAIFINLGISYFKGSVLPFVAPITLGTIQLGATIDYAILLTTTYLKNRKTMSKEDAIKDTLKYTSTSIIVSAMCFFAATFGVGVYSDLEMVGSLCSLISRGAVISMLVVLIVLPSVLLTFDKILIKGRDNMKKNKLNKKLVAGLLIGLTLLPLNTYALTKNETVYTILNSDGSVNKTTVNESILNKKNVKEINDYTVLDNIINLSSGSEYSKNGKNLTWSLNDSNILYKGTTNKSLPIGVKVTYKLNGEKKELKDILGKSGNVEIIIDYTNLDKHTVNVNGTKTTMYTPFVVVTGTYIDNKNNSDIKVTNGKTYETAGKTFVSMISTPGLIESLGGSKELNEVKISYKTTKFELNSIYSVVMPKIVDKSILSNFDKLDPIYSKFSELQTNMDLIVSSSKELKDGTSLLKNTLNNSIGNLTTENLLTKEKKDLISSSAVDGVNKTFTEEYVNNLSESVWKEVEASMANGDEALEAKVKNILVNYLTEVGLLRDYVNCETGKAVVSMGGEMTSEQQRSCALVLADKALPYFETLTNEVSSYVAEKVSKSVSTSVSKNVALETAKSISVEVSTSVTNQLLIETKKSLNELYLGITKIDDGMNALYNGLDKYNKEGINTLSNALNNAKTMEEKVKALVNLGSEYDSFAGSNMDSDTKFIMVINKEEAPKENTVKVTKEKETLWTRIKNLFK
ncbi:MAG: MMPL family transporter [Tenericutes bacterium]|nr:MMPL family transporter [Mycoplasmatota bacterium]